MSVHVKTLAKQKKLYLYLMIALLLNCCGYNKPGTDIGDSANDTGGYRCNLIFPDDVPRSVSNHKAVTDKDGGKINCTAAGISIVRFSFQDSDNVVLIDSTFPCHIGRGETNNVPVGTGIRVVVTAENGNGIVLFSGEERDVTIFKNEVTKGKQIFLYPGSINENQQNRPDVHIEEVCNGIDDDNDGQVDEDIPVQQTTCGLGACDRNAGELKCINGSLVDTCISNQGAIAEVCDEVDNDCDGQTDEGIDCDCNGNETRETTCGIGACEENTGTQVCENGTWGENTCDPLNGAGAEICDGIDNDCDGSIDENLTRQTSCGVGACAENTGTETCYLGTWVGNTCNRYAGASAEVCDNEDNDCNGAVDDDLPIETTTCGVGACIGNVGQRRCEEGVWLNTCDPEGGASEEVCDNIDNDCDGEIDEDISPIPFSPETYYILRFNGVVSNIPYEEDNLSWPDEFGTVIQPGDKFWGTITYTSDALRQDSGTEYIYYISNMNMLAFIESTTQIRIDIPLSSGYININYSNSYLLWCAGDIGNQTSPEIYVSLPPSIVRRSSETDPPYLYLDPTLLESIGMSFLQFMRPLEGSVLEINTEIENACNE